MIGWMGERICFCSCYVCCIFFLGRAEITQKKQDGEKTADLSFHHFASSSAAGTGTLPAAGPSTPCAAR